MARWTPVIYKNCKRCSRYPCPMVKRLEEQLREGAAVPVVVRAAAGPRQAASDLHQQADNASEAQPEAGDPSSRSGRSDVGRALPFFLLGVAVLLLASLEGRPR